MTLSEIYNQLRTLNLTTSLVPVENSAWDAIEISKVVEDSRQAMPGSLFVAVSGEQFDGHDFIMDAIDRGAVAILGSCPTVDIPGFIPYIQVKELRKSAALLAHTVLGDPTKGLTVIGVTGTNGKTSTIHLIHTILRYAGLEAAQFGTLGYMFKDAVVDAPHTTPFGSELAAMFARARDEGLSHVVMEVSSHALAQDRVAGVHFDCAAFTNLTQDHLDFHGDMDSYCQAKMRLFTCIPPDTGLAVVNAEDPASERFLSATSARSLTYGKKSDCRAIKVNIDFDGAHFELVTPWGNTPVSISLLGRHNISNALCATAVCGGLGLSLEQIAGGLQALKSVPGRFEAVMCRQPFYVVVDYAHTDDGLKNVLEAARKLCEGEVIVIFGCGGDRDKTKRPKMGAVAAQLADYCILTSDNPRTEDPHRILLDVELGVQHAGKRKNDDYLVIEDREEAIRTGIKRAKLGDLVLIAGKGHEDYQIRGTDRFHFDDREMAKKILREL